MTTMLACLGEGPGSLTKVSEQSKKLQGPRPPCLESCELMAGTDVLILVRAPPELKLH